VRAIGWWVEEYGLAQVSINIEDFRVTPPHAAFEACVEEARALNVGVAGSELVGLIPLDAMLLAAEHYIDKEDLFVLDERQKIRLVVERLGLSSVQPFVPERRIIEYMIPKDADEPLASMSVRSFVELLGSRTPAPGGGSASALVAALGAALGAMVGWMTQGKRKFEEKEPIMRRLIPPLHEAMKALLPMIDRDTRAFSDYMAALGMAKGTPEEKALRHAAMQDGLKKAVQVPLEVMRIGDRCWEAMVEMAAHGNIASASDLEVGAKALEAGIWGASRNVAINLPSIEDEGFRRTIAGEADALSARAAAKRDEVLATLAARKA
jgi:glutamate formiminotransferase/formiminotetrahydrofolate cyclodeaminase